jgi:hypothetical protein
MNFLHQPTLLERIDQCLRLSNELVMLRLREF